MTQVLGSTDAVEIENTGEIPASKDLSLINDDSDDVIDTKEEAFTVESGDTKELNVTFDTGDKDKQDDTLKLASSDTTIEFEDIDVKYHGRGGPWLRRGLWREASVTPGDECNSARARFCGDSHGTSNTRTHRECHRNRGRLLLPWRVCP